MSQSGAGDQVLFHLDPTVHRAAYAELRNIRFARRALLHAGLGRVSRRAGAPTIGTVSWACAHEEGGRAQCSSAQITLGTLSPGAKKTVVVRRTWSTASRYPVTADALRRLRSRGRCSSPTDATDSLARAPERTSQRPRWSAATFAASPRPSRCETSTSSSGRVRLTTHDELRTSYLTCLRWPPLKEFIEGYGHDRSWRVFDRDPRSMSRARGVFFRALGGEVVL
jgi:hypothetical protein